MSDAIRPPPDDFDDLPDTARHAVMVSTPTTRAWIAKAERRMRELEGSRDSVPPRMPRWLWALVAGIVVPIVLGGGTLAGATYLQARDTAQQVAEDRPAHRETHAKMRADADAALDRHETYGHRDVAEALHALDRRLGRIEAQLEQLERRRPGGR